MTIPTPQPRHLTLTGLRAWVRDLRPLDPHQREAFFTSLEKHYGKATATKIRRQVEGGNV